MKSTLIILSVTWLAPVATLNATEFKLAAVLSDHMVLQRDLPVPVWGWADPACTLVNAAGLPASPFRTDAWADPIVGNVQP